MTTETIDYEAIKTRQQVAWSTGDYPRVGNTLQTMAERLVEAAEVHAGQRVLDVACGQGNVALAAARRFADATGIDYVPDLLVQGRARAEAEHLPVELTQADAENLPFPEASFDQTLSTVGVMFAPHQEQAAAELLRVTRPGGTIGLVSLDAGRHDRRDVQGDRQVRAAAGRGEVADAVGHRGPAARAVRRRGQLDVHAPGRSTSSTARPSTSPSGSGSTTDRSPSWPAPSTSRRRQPSPPTSPTWPGSSTGRRTAPASPPRSTSKRSAPGADRPHPWQPSPARRRPGKGRRRATACVPAWYGQPAELGQHGEHGLAVAPQQRVRPGHHRHGDSVSLCSNGCAGHVLSRRRVPGQAQRPRPRARRARAARARRARCRAAPAVRPTAAPARGRRHRGAAGRGRRSVS